MVQNYSTRNLAVESDKMPRFPAVRVLSEIEQGCILCRALETNSDE
jgi:hypothetical protein